jgi:hypothetical protein
MQVDGRDPTRFSHFEYTNQTTLHPLGVSALVVAIVWVLMSSRRQVIWPVIMLMCFVSPAQRIVIGGLDMPFMRIIVVLALLQTVFLGGNNKLRVSWMDAAVLVLAFIPVVFSLARGQLAVLTTHIGHGGDLFTSYWLARQTMRSFEDLRVLATALAVAAIPSGLLFLNEYTTGRNIFAIFGGVKEITVERLGKLRCMGPFPHAIIAGVWWVVAAPLIASLWWSRDKGSKYLVQAVFGFSGAAIVVLCSNSSTPVSALYAMIVMALCYPLRKQFGKLGWTTFAILCVLHLVSQSGLHHLVFARFSVVAGSTGYHRFFLYDQALSRVADWGLVGANSTYSWGWGLDDVTSWYVKHALSSGLIGLSLTIALLIGGVRTCWKAVVRLESHPAEQAIAYAIGMSILLLALTGLGVSFFGQSSFLYAFILGLVPALKNVPEMLGDTDLRVQRAQRRPLREQRDQQQVKHVQRGARD